MDGLECSEVNLSELKIENPNFRIDSDFFNKQVLRKLNMIKNHNHYYLKPKNIVNGPFGSTLTIDSHLKNGYIPLVRSININQGFFVNHNDLVFISEEDNNIIKHSQLNKDDIVLSRVGSIGFFARVDADMGTCNISSNNIGIKLNNFHEREKHFILTYLNTKFAYELTNRRISGNVQPKLTVEEICHIPIPEFSETFYMLISSLILKSEQVRKQLQVCYLSAEMSLISALSMTDFIPSTEKISIKNLSDSFGASSRLDAEYYQQKYEQIEKALLQPQRVEECCKLLDTNYIPNEKISYKYIELSNVGTEGDINNVDTIVGIELPSRARRQVKTGQVIISSIEGSLNSCAIVTEEYNNALCSTGFYVIESDSINSETLLILFKSPPIQSLMRKRCSGTILTAISKDEFLHLPLPTISLKTQNEIAVKVQESFLLRKQSKELLERAVQAVEMAIEKDEQTAMDWIRNLE